MVRARRRVARFGDGWHTLRLSPSQFAEGRRDIIQRTEAEGRDPARLHFSITLPVKFTGAPPSAAIQDRTALTGTDMDIADTVRAYEAAGVDEIVLGVSTADLALNNEAMVNFMEQVWSKI